MHERVQLTWVVRMRRAVSELGSIYFIVSSPPLAAAEALTNTETAPRIGEAAIPVRVVAREVALFRSPSARAPRRGTLARGALTFIHQYHRGAGCDGDWALVGASAWACATPSAFEMRRLDDRVVHQQGPPTFARIAGSGAVGYRTLDSAEQELPDAELQPDFFVGVAEERLIHGEPFVRTTHDIWISKRDLVPIVPHQFAGVELDPFDGAIVPVGWVFVGRAVPRRSVAGATVASVQLPRLTRVSVLETRQHSDHHEWYRTPDGWLSDRELRVPHLATIPDVVGPNERWLDIDRRTQTLLAFVGPTPVFATLVSTGRGSDRSATATPGGIHRIWVKLLSTDMDNLDEQAAAAAAEDAPKAYSVEAVPFVMFFSGGYGLHATYWHDAFGSPRSHGCVNLSLRDAAWLFEFSSPRLVPGWQAVHPDDYDHGTVVRVR